MRCASLFLLFFVCFSRKWITHFAKVYAVRAIFIQSTFCEPPSISRMMMMMGILHGIFAAVVEVVVASNERSKAKPNHMWMLWMLPWNVQRPTENTLCSLCVWDADGGGHLVTRSALYWNQIIESSLSPQLSYEAIVFRIWFRTCSQHHRSARAELLTKKKRNFYFCARRSRQPLQQSLIGWMGDGQRRRMACNVCVWWQRLIAFKLNATHSSLF